jgi:hypothetical protein
MTENACEAVPLAKAVLPQKAQIRRSRKLAVNFRYFCNSAIQFVPAAQDCVRFSVYMERGVRYEVDKVQE